MRRTLIITGVAATMLLGCGGDTSSTGGNEAKAAVESAVEAGTVIIDVRSVEEFSAGHLEGALNFNVEDGTLATQLSVLDPAADYIVYCRSGRRSAIAADMMRNAGFDTVVDLGSIEDAAKSTGLPITTN
jgi:rhodanese-related sulfurtransferase